MDRVHPFERAYRCSQFPCGVGATLAPWTMCKQPSGGLDGTGGAPAHQPSRRSDAGDSMSSVPAMKSTVSHTHQDVAMTL
jgi:hypothetical protein